MSARDLIDELTLIGIEQTADYGLREWARWMRKRGDIRELGYPATSSGLTSGGINCWDDVEDSGLGDLADGVNAIVDGLPTIEQSAIYHVYLASVFRARPGMLEQALVSGIRTVAKMMVVKGLA